MTAKFYDRAVDSGHAGDDGRPVYRLATYFTVQMDANNTIDREARDADKERYPAEFDLYQRTRQPDAEGFPLAAWTGVNAAERQGLADRGIFTVEKLAETNMSKAPPEMREAQTRAKAFLEKTSQDAPKLAARIAELEDENGGLKDQIEDMKSAIEDLKKDSDTGKFEQQIDSLKADLEKAKGEVTRLEAAASSFERQSEEAAQENERLTKELAAAKSAKK